MHLAGKFNKTKTAGKLNKNQGDKSEKTSPNWANFHKNTPKIACSSRLKQQKRHKIWKNSNPQNRSLQKNKQISIETSPQISNPQVFKKSRNSTKKLAQIRGKIARLATLPCSLQDFIERSVTLVLVSCCPHYCYYDVCSLSPWLATA